MGKQRSHGKPLDVGGVGVAREGLPPWDQGPVDLAGWFGPDRRDRPVELEIGSGKGTFLVQQASRLPEVNFIGLEYARAYWRYAADRCRRRGLANVRVVHAEAAFFVNHFVPDGTLRQVHIYFPDPWPKNRHHKRRLVQAPLLRRLWRVLEPGGMVRLCTDHADYFQWMQQHAAEVTERFDCLPFDAPGSGAEGELVGTNFERKYRREGRSFHGMVLRRRDEPAPSA